MTKTGAERTLKGTSKGQPHPHWHVCVNTRKYTHTHIYTHMYTHTHPTHTYMYTHIHTGTDTHTYTSTHVHLITKESELHHSIYREPNRRYVDGAHPGPKTNRDYLGRYCP